MKTRHTLWNTVLLISAWIASANVIADNSQTPATPPEPPLKLNTTANHTKFEILHKDFKSGPEVTRACLSCHTEAARQIHRTKHWTWEYVNPDNMQRLGKKNVLNNYCVAIPSNYAFCNTCHVGYGRKDKNFDFSSEANVDCLVCHDTTGSYIKASGMAGHPAYQDMEFPPGSGKIIRAVDLQRVAQQVGKTSRDTCGACHFHGGGGDGVKHGDMDSSLAAPDRALDVHMDATGADFTCATCHMTTGHQVPGSRYAPTAMDKGGRHMRGKLDKSNPGTCQSCHGDQPHAAEVGVLNKHSDKVACQTCHIPAMARGGIPTTMFWDWSTAGKMGPDGMPMVKTDSRGRAIYSSKKGDFTLGENVIPDYIWFNGKVRYTLLTDKIDKTAGVTKINHFEGSPKDGKSRIWPVKIVRGVQPYDPVAKSLVIPHTTGTDETSYWKNFNWEKAIATGMNYAGAPFSGKVDFIRTEMTWPLNHMVAPKENALDCKECHQPNGRMKNLPGFHVGP
ncbi:MAG: tetrathionate reductase family octaheme c-type cytochrome [Sulfuricella sp.]|jgi:octaheme c-type cytochrome (tetrathionate reductase family)